MRFIYLILVCLAAVGCTSPPLAPSPARRPSAEDSGADFSADEISDCHDVKCESFMAPCDLFDEHRARAYSEREDYYRAIGEDLRSHGFCLRVPRALSDLNYSHGTCLFIFLNQESCR